MTVNRLLAAATALALAAAPAAAQTGEDQTGEEQRPALVVAVVVDQLSANLFNQYRPHFRHGLRRLAEEGLVHINGYQSHGVTVTCAGHATVLTGTHPARNGVIANDWIDTTTGEEVYCLAAPENTLAHGGESDNGLVGPRQMGATTLGDWLKTISPESLSVAVSGKDRGAITLAGQNDDGAYWFTETGLTTQVTPGQSAEARLAPMAAFNAELAEALSQGGLGWDYQHEQCRALAADWIIGGETFRSDLPPERFSPDTSPLFDEATLAAAGHLLDALQLGRRGVTDVLGVSLSGTDRIGHRLGTQGPEMCEQLLRLDAALGEFLARLDALPGGVALVLTADHGGSDMAERMIAHDNPDAWRGDGGLDARVNAALRERFDLDFNPLRASARGIIVTDADGVGLAEPLRGQIVEAAVEMLNVDPLVALAVARDELLAEPIPTEPNPELLTLRERLRLSTAPGRSPDILRAWRPFYNGGARIGGTIASHGSPWDYDRRVPIIFWRTGSQQGQERFWPIRTVDIAPTLAAVVGVEPEGEIDGRCFELGWADGPACPAGD